MPESHNARSREPEWATPVEMLQPLSDEPLPTPERRSGLAPAWWIATAPEGLNGKRKLGPFATRELALEVRAYVEKVEQRVDLWVVTGDDIPSR